MLTADNYILVTGGDDNAVHVTLITIEKLVAMETDSERSMAVTCTGSTLSAHAAQITGKLDYQRDIYKHRLISFRKSDMHFRQ